jgi:hypothetical protein
MNDGNFVTGGGGIDCQVGSCGLFRVIAYRSFPSSVLQNRKQHQQHSVIRKKVLHRVQDVRTG